MQGLLYKKISGYKRTWRNVLNNKLSVTVTEGYRQGLGDFTHRRQAKILLGSWMEIAGDFSGQLVGITTGKEREVGPWRTSFWRTDRGKRRQENKGARDLKMNFRRGSVWGSRNAEHTEPWERWQTNTAALIYDHSKVVRERRGQSKAIIF